MKSNRGKFVPIGDLALNLPGVPLKAIRGGDPPMGRHFTRFD